MKLSLSLSLSHLSLVSTLFRRITRSKSMCNYFGVFGSIWHSTSLCGTCAQFRKQHYPANIIVRLSLGEGRDSWVIDGFDSFTRRFAGEAHLSFSLFPSLFISFSRGVPAFWLFARCALRVVGAIQSRRERFARRLREIGLRNRDREKSVRNNVRIAQSLREILWGILSLACECV